MKSQIYWPLCFSAIICLSLGCSSPVNRAQDMDGAIEVSEDYVPNVSLRLDYDFALRKLIVQVDNHSDQLIEITTGDLYIRNINCELRKYYFGFPSLRPYEGRALLIFSSSPNKRRITADVDRRHTRGWIAAGELAAFVFDFWPFDMDSEDCLIPLPGSQYELCLYSASASYISIHSGRPTNSRSYRIKVEPIVVTIPDEVESR